MKNASEPNRRRGQLATALVALLLPLTASATANELSAKEIGAAQKLYTVKCAKCHKFYDPKAYEQGEWDSWMRKMQKKSKLKPEQFELLSRYIDNNLRSDKKVEPKAK